MAESPVRYFYDEWPNPNHPHFTDKHKELRLWVAVFPRNGIMVGFRPDGPGVVV